MAAAAVTLLGLECDWVEVSEELKFFWHRPPWATVEEQITDSETVRIFLNGCFDLMHVGHFNALRQAKRLFFQQGYKKVVLVAGIHSDDAIARHKGPPMMSDDERIAVLEATKWVDEFVTHLPYVSMSAQLADALRVKWICHGDDMPICEGGGGMYSDAVEKGRFQLLKRTEGISTTQIIQRLIRQQGLGSETEVDAMESALATTQRLGQFAAPADPEQDAKLLTSAKTVVYVPGIFDLVHPGHVSILRQAAKLGDYLLVGLYSDEMVRLHRGTPPVLTMLERAMAVLSTRWVDDVVLGVPWKITKELLATMNISMVIVGRPPDGLEPKQLQAEEDQMDLARSQGILKQLWSSFAVSSEALTLGPSTGCWSARTFVHLGFGGVEGVVIRGSPNNSPS
ncbi:pctA [Symbiodinium natans]|uniref:ethanolamine-phosphate cytidylyltransferase n=1 Tax=Symbiodinium natans TaxID=878477 RepID=A0A812TBM5_9DINO|nr:pctA [Symbiodinium natans]